MDGCQGACEGPQGDTAMPILLAATRRRRRTHLGGLPNLGHTSIRCLALAYENGEGTGAIRPDQ